MGGKYRWSGGCQEETRQRIGIWRRRRGVGEGWRGSAGWRGSRRRIGPMAHGAPSKGKAEGKGAPTIVIGVAGGIGSGKSALARALGRLGLEVVDADREAKALLDRADVRAQLVESWGTGILDGEGRVDRARVAHRIFTNGESRAWLERLIHPLVIERCEEAIARARRAGRAGVVIDAPLLYEAGLDGLCDAVVFVDASVEVRAERVSRSRGWESGELERREAAQMDLAEKRDRSRFVVENNSSELSALEERAAGIYDILRSEAGPGPG